MNDSGKRRTLTARQARILYDLIMQDYRAGKLKREDCRALLDTMLFRDRDGEIWTIGAKSGNWFRRDGDRWVEETPSGPLRYISIAERPPAPAGKPASASAVASSPAPAICAHCGTPIIPGTRFCTRCGAPVV
jgi:hypothetical protein